MMALTEYLLFKHAASLAQEKQSSATIDGTCPANSDGGAKRFGRALYSAWRQVRKFFARAALEHNDRKSASENLGRREVNPPLRGLF